MQHASVLKDVIAAIRTEQERRMSRYDPDFLNELWPFTDGPFINELCIMVLVTLRHQVERDLVGLAARATDDGKEISAKQYQEKLKQLQKPNQWKEIEKRLETASCEKYKSIEALRLLVNSYKHDPSIKPDEKLLSLLGLETGVKYARLPESDDLRKGLANCIGLKEDASYCDIAERFVGNASDFVAEVQVKNSANLSIVNRGRGGVSLKPSDFER